MDPDPKPSRAAVKPIVSDRLAARRARTRRVRRAVAGGATAAFAAVWIAIYVQLASGHDPALARGSTAASTLPGAAVSAAAGDTSGGAADQQQQSYTVDSAPASSPKPLTTRQS